MIKHLYRALNLLMLLATCCTGKDKAGPQEWQIKLLGENTTITAFEIDVDKENAIVSVLDKSQGTKSPVPRVLRISLPNGDVTWVKEIDFRPTSIELSKLGQYIRITSPAEFGTSQLLILKSNGKKIFSQKQAKGFFIGGEYILCSYDPQVSFEEYKSKFKTEAVLRDLSSNRIVDTCNPGGEILDAVAWGSGMRVLVIRKGDLVVFEAENLPKCVLRQVGIAAKEIIRDNMTAFFLNSEVLVIEDFVGEVGNYALNIKKDGLKRLALDERFITNATMPENGLEFACYTGGAVYFLDTNKVIAISFNEDVGKPLNLFKKFAGNVPKIELLHSAYYRSGKNRFFLQIPEKSSNISIRQIN